MAFFLAPSADARPQFFDSQGNVLAGGWMYWYAATTTTPQDTFTTSAGSVANSNPIELDAAGRPKSGVGIYLTEGLGYKLVLKDVSLNTIFTQDNIVGITTALTNNEWSSSGLTATYISASQFSFPGDQTTDAHKRRRLKVIDAGGTKYGTITASAFSTLTTVTVEIDGGGSLSNPITSVSWSVITATNPSIDPDMVHRKSSDAVASAATTDIWSIQGDYVHITGNTGPITSFGTAPYAGAQRVVIFDSTPTITHNATTLQCPGGVNIFTAAGDRAMVRADTTANMIITDFVKASGLPVVGTSVLRSYLAGLTMSTAGASATMSVAAGMAADSTNSVMMSLASSISKTTSAWAVGTAAGGLDTGSIATATWYKFYEIMRPDTGVVDVIFTTAALGTGPLMPTGYTKFRYIGSGLTNGSSQWVAFTQDGDLFQLVAPVLETTSANPGTSAVTQTLANVPTGLNVNAFLNVAGSGSFIAYLSDLSTNDAAPSSTVTPLATTGGPAIATFGAQAWVRTNTSAQIRTRISASGGGQQLFVCTLGWRDTRGRDA